MVERRPTDVVPGPRVRLALAAIVFDFVNPLGLPNKLLLGLAAPALPNHHINNQKFNLALVVLSAGNRYEGHVINKDKIVSRQ